MKRLLAIAVGVLCVASTARSQDTQAAANPIDKLRWMVGTWVGEDGAGAEKETVQMKAWLAPSGHAVLYHVDVIHGGKTTPRYDGMYYWIAAQNAFAIRQSAITGGVVEGDLKLDGAKALQTETVFNPDGTKASIKIEYTIEAQKFHIHAQFRANENSDWIPALEMDYRKVE